MAWLALQLLACAAVIGAAGTQLVRSADRIGAATGLSGGWVGLALLATVTSLPELASGVSAVARLDAPDLAVGNALGACAFNLLFLAVVDTLQRSRPIYQHASAAHLLSAAFGVVMLGLVALGMQMGERAPALLHLGAYSPLMLGLYLLALRSVFLHERGAGIDAPAPAPGRGPAAPWLRFATAAAAVLAASLWLPELVDRFAAAVGWNRSFAGTLLMAVATTLPEASVTLAALRLRAVDMAVANLLGSNLFNVVVLAVDDAAFARGPLLAHASPVHVATALTAIVMTGLVAIGLVMRPRGRALGTASWVSIGLMAAYLLNAALLYALGR
jgi:cation:H+ antiporter